MSDDEGYAPAAQMLICFIFSACVLKNTDSDDRCQQNPASRFSPFCSLCFRNLRGFVATFTTFLLRSPEGFREGRQKIAAGVIRSYRHFVDTRSRREEDFPAS